jgi:hypothetical protein
MDEGDVFLFLWMDSSIFIEVSCLYIFDGEIINTNTNHRLRLVRKLNDYQVLHTIYDKKLSI